MPTPPKTPGIFVISTTTIIFPRIEPDGSFHLPGENEIISAVTKEAERSARESLRGLDGNLLTMISYTGQGITYGPNPNPLPEPAGPWWSTLKLWKGGAKSGSFVLSIAPTSMTPLYNRAGGTVVSQRKIDYEMKVWDVTPDPRIHTLAWIKVSESPEFWVQSSTVKAKPT